MFRSKIRLSLIIVFVTIIALFSGISLTMASGNVITNGTQFRDTSGNIINAHGGGLLKYGDYYYWYGEYRTTGNLFLGVRCYRSKDLVNWEYRGEVLDPNSHPELNRVNIERPKVMYNASTKEFVMWMHWENGVHYGEARAAVAYCDTPDGKFTYLGSFRPYQDSGVVDHGRPGYMSRDCNVFVDTDGTGYFISSSNENMDLYLYELTPDYKNIASLAAKLYVGRQREAPCLIKKNDYYYLITSGCSGWQPNQGQYAYSKNLRSGWSSLYNFGNSTTYRSQPAYVIAVQGTSETTYLYTGDRWAGAWGGRVNESQYVWLPIIFTSDTRLELPYYQSIEIDAAAGIIKEHIPDKTRYKIVNRNSGKVLDVKNTSANASEIVQWSDNGQLSQQWYLVDVGDGYTKIVNVESGRALDVKDGATTDGGVLIQYTSNGGHNQQWRFREIENGYNKIISRSSNKLIDVHRWSTDDGATIQQWSDANGTNQHWQLVIVEDNVPKVLLGDVSGDGNIDSTDCILLRRYLLGIIDSLPAQSWRVIADVNQDGKIDSTDYILMRRHVLGIIDLTTL
ncbi:UNVERIFIED_CONTAM: Beta-xylosidase [Acetivibrio alkalicellulosi]